jgi:DNA repair exonuclease SbcCD ATPase subunit
MKTQATILTLLLATLLSGCGVKEEDHQRVLTELDETKQALEQCQSEVSTLKDKLTSAEKELARSKSELSAASSRASELTAEVERLKRQDTYAFTEAGRLLDSGDLSGALRAYEAFVRDFPSSPQTASAKTQIAQIEQRLESQRREAVARAEREKQEQARRDLAERLRSGALTSDEWGPILRGKTMAQIHEILGAPDTTHDRDEQWGYNRRIIHPVTGKTDTLVINFHGTGRVNSFSASYTGTRWSP